jgi:hypothetical protein
MKIIDEINRQIEVITTKGVTPQYISFNLTGYKKFIIEEKIKGFPDKYKGLPIILNPQQKSQEQVVVLADPTSELLYCQ